MLSGLNVLITGASSGIGRSAAIVMSKHGARVFGAGRNETSLQGLKEDNVLVDYVVADLTAENECQRVVKSANDSLGGLTTGKSNCFLENMQKSDYSSCK